MGATFHLNRRHCGIFRLPGSQVGHNLDTGNVVVWLIVKSFGEPKQGILYDHIIFFPGRHQDCLLLSITVGLCQGLLRSIGSGSNI